MLKFSFDRIFRARGIDKPFSFLIHAGLSDNFATKLKNDKVKAIGLEQLEKLCIALRCTPNEIFDWRPDKYTQPDKDHPMHTITKSEKVMDLKNIMHSVSMDELDDIEEFIKAKVEARKDKS